MKNDYVESKSMLITIISLKASTVSSIDCQIRNGTFDWALGQKPSFPIVPGVS